MNYRWNPKAVPNKRWGVRLFHKADRRCLKVEGKTGDRPPDNYYPCEHCFPRTSKNNHLNGHR